MFRHNPQGLEFGTTYRTDSASGSDTPITVYTSDGTLSPIAPTVGASGSTMQEHDPRGGDTVFYASQATVYLKPINYYNGTPTGTGVLTSTGSTAPSLPAGSPAAQYAVDPAFTGTYVQITDAQLAEIRRGKLLRAPVAATRTAYFESFQADAGRCTRMRHQATGDVIDLMLVFGNYGSQDAEPNGPIKVRASIEVPSGTFYPVHFANEDANRDVTIPAGGIVTSLPVAVPIASLTEFFTNTLVVPVNTQYPKGGLVIATNLQGGNVERCAIGATDYTTTTNPGTASDQFAYGPVAVIGTPTARKPSVGVVGDSLATGTGDGLLNNRYESGYIVRALLTANLPYIQLGRNGESGLDWGTASATVIGRHRYRALLAASCDYVVQEHITNDFGNSNNTVAQAQVTMISIWSQLYRRGVKTFAVTCTPRTTSTDSWATTTNQTPVNTRFGPESGAGSDRQQYNAWIRDGAPLTGSTAAAVGTVGAARCAVYSPAGVKLASASGPVHPLAGVLDPAGAVEQFDSGTQVWAWKPSYTADGIHPTPTAAAAMAVAVPAATIFV